MSCQFHIFETKSGSTIKVNIKKGAAYQKKLKTVALKHSEDMFILTFTTIVTNSNLNTHNFTEF